MEKIEYAITTEKPNIEAWQLMTSPISRNRTLGLTEFDLKEESRSHSSIS